MAVVKNLPKTEDGYGILCRSSKGEFQISQNTSKTKDRFTLWKITSGGYEKIASANTPYDLYEQAGFQKWPPDADEEPQKKRRAVSRKRAT